MMKAIIAKTLITLAALAVVVPFITVALLVGMRAVAMAEGLGDDMLIVSLVVVGAIISSFKGLGRQDKEEAYPAALHIAARKADGRRGIHMNPSGC